MKNHTDFWSDLAGRIGPAIFAATLVVCLLFYKFEIMHLILFGSGIVLTALSYLLASKNRRD